MHEMSFPLFLYQNVLSCLNNVFYSVLICFITFFVHRLAVYPLDMFSYIKIVLSL